MTNLRPNRRRTALRLGALGTILLFFGTGFESVAVETSACLNEEASPSVELVEESISNVDEPTLTQFAILDSLVAGVYDGFATIGDLKKFGDFGIGTFDRIDGEAIVVDGVVYQVKGTGVVSTPPDETTVPFASVVKFLPTRRARVESQSFATLCRTVDELVSNENIFVAIRVRGRFSGVRTRSAFAQSKPYQPLDVAMKNQPEFEIGVASGELVGFRMPNFMRGLNLPGYHVHFLTDEKSRGGHVLNVFVEDAELEIATCRRFQLVLPPETSEFYESDLTVDYSDATERVESTPR